MRDDWRRCSNRISNGSWDFRSALSSIVCVSTCMAFELTKWTRDSIQSDTSTKWKNEFQKAPRARSVKTTTANKWEKNEIPWRNIRRSVKYQNYSRARIMISANVPCGFPFNNGSPLAANDMYVRKEKSWKKCVLLFAKVWRQTISKTIIS